ncbi:hypothetical protein [Thermococcus guaymasensis]|nr:hypothetical protein [Thermococcus guaymasensis]
MENPLVSQGQERKLSLEELEHVYKVGEILRRTIELVKGLRK